MVDKQLAALNVIDFSILAAASTGTTRFSDAVPALTNGLVSGRTIRRFLITTATAAFRWRTDATPATAGTGHIGAINDSLSFTGANYRQLAGSISFIASASTCNIAITWFD